MDKIQVRLSQFESPEAFRAALDAHRTALSDHRLGEPDQPAPIANELLDRLIQRVPEPGPVEDRGPDRFEIAPYEIVDDTPPPPAPPTLAERKQVLLIELNAAGQAAIDKLLSPARARLLSMEYGDAALKPVNKRTAADKATIKKFTVFSSRAAEINRSVARAGVSIEELTNTDINDWTVPTFE
jgi:hypothetical protein